MYICVNEVEVGVNDSVFFGNEQQKVSFMFWSITRKVIPPSTLMS